MAEQLFVGLTRHEERDLLAEGEVNDG